MLQRMHARLNELIREASAHVLVAIASLCLIM